MNKKMTLVKWLALITLYLAWGSTYLAIRYAVDSLPPFFMAGSRFLVAGLIVYTWRRLAGDPAPTRLQWRSAIIIGLFMLVGGIGIVSWVEQYMTSGITALIVATVPLWIVLIDAIRPGGKRPTLQMAIGILVGLVGILILVAPVVRPGSQAGYPLAGVIALMLATFFWAVGSIYSRGADLPGSPLLGTGMEMLAGSLGLYLVGLVMGEAGHLTRTVVTTRSLLGLAYLILVGSLIGFAAYTWLLRVAPTSTVATYAFINPIVAIILGSVLAHEILTTYEFFAIAVILFAVALILSGHRKLAKATDMRISNQLNPGVFTTIDSEAAD